MRGPVVAVLTGTALLALAPAAMAHGAHRGAGVAHSGHKVGAIACGPQVG